jgi:hypothetical protein
MIDENGDRQTDPDTLIAMARRLERVEELCERAADYSMKGYQIASSRTAVAWIALAVALIALVVASCAAAR